MTNQLPWCCTGRGYVSECPLCPQYGTSLLDPCPGHPETDTNRQAITSARLHAEHRHPGWEYRTTTGPRKQWDNPEEPPHDEYGEPEPGWEANVDAGRPGQGWDRFDYHEEAYWRRRKPTPARSASTACAVLHTDSEGNSIPCPGYPHADEGPEPASGDQISRFDNDPEALAWARGKVQEYLDRLAEFEAQAEKNRNAVMAYSCGVASETTRKHFLGDGERIVGVFDERLPHLAHGTADKEPTT